jgi:hypothetical protein
VSILNAIQFMAEPSMSLLGRYALCRSPRSLLLRDLERTLQDPYRAVDIAGLVQIYANPSRVW